MHNAPAAFPTVQAKPWYAHRWPWLLMAGPAAVVLAGIYTIWLAFSRPDALVVDDYYKQGKAINQDLRRDHAAAALGLSFSLRYDAAAGRLNGRMLGREQPVAGSLRLRLIHPTRPDLDVGFIVQADQNGAFSATLPLLERARWQVQVESETRSWRLHGPWKWPEQRSIEIIAEPVR